MGLGGLHGGEAYCGNVRERECMLQRAFALFLIAESTWERDIGNNAPMLGAVAFDSEELRDRGLKLAKFAVCFLVESIQVNEVLHGTLAERRLTEH